MVLKINAIFFELSGSKETEKALNTFKSQKNVWW
jgi:hypothetical protein